LWSTNREAPHYVERDEFMQSQLIANRYRVLRAIGRGGMGAVWLCRDETLGHQVAVKQMGALSGESSDGGSGLRATTGWHADGLEVLVASWVRDCGVGRVRSARQENMGTVRSSVEAHREP
jgi:hypothetical protein